jgi:hypothetical protein
MFEIDVDQRNRAYFHPSEPRANLYYFSVVQIDDIGWAPVWLVSLVCTIFRHSAKRARLTRGIEGRRRGEGIQSTHVFG